MTDQTDVYVAQTSGAMNVFSVGSAGMWSKPAVISEPGFQAPPWATIVAAAAGSTAPAAAFVDLKGRLPLPASGQILRRFGTPDGYGGSEKGLSIGARDMGVVIAPADGWVAFSGPYRSYGQLLIINAGGGYYIVLAGMARINVNVGQFVLAGVGDGTAQTAATIAIGAKQPILYVEFRKDGTSIDPGPWWARSDTRKVGG